MKHFFLSALVFLFGCFQTQVGGIQPIQEPGDGLSPSGDGPFGVGVYRSIHVNRARPSFDFDLFLPTPTQSPAPVLIFVQGGRVDEDDYEWFARRAASWGFAVAVPKYPLDLAFFGKSRTRDTIDALQQLKEGPFFDIALDLERIAVGGHSLGGVVADRASDRDNRISALFFWGSFPGDGDGDQFKGATLSIAGSSDCLTATEEAIEGIALYSAPKAYAEIEGVTHFQFTQSDTKDLEDGCLPAISLEEAHSKISALTIPFLQSALSNDNRFISEFTSPREGVFVQAELSVDGSFLILQ